VNVRNVYALGAVSALADISSEMIFPILPIFLVTYLSAPLPVVGLVGGAGAITLMLAQGFSGWLSDKIKRRKAIVFGGYGFSASAKLFLPLAAHWAHVLLVEVGDRFGKGLRDPPRDALVAESMPASMRGRAFGIHRTLDTTGAIIGTVIASVLLAASLDIRTVFWIAIIPAAVATAAIPLAVKEIAPRGVRPIGLAFVDHEFRKFLLTAVVFTFANFSYAFYILRAQNVGLALFLIPILYLVYNIFYAVLSYPAGRLSDRVGRKATLAAGTFVLSATALGFAFIDTGTAVFAWPLFALYGAQVAFTDAVSRAYVSDLVPARKATAIGAYFTVSGIAALPSSILAGTVWQIFGPPATFVYAAALSALAGLLLLTIMKK